MNGQIMNALRGGFGLLEPCSSLNCNFCKKQCYGKILSSLPLKQRDLFTQLISLKVRDINLVEMLIKPLIPNPKP